MLSGSTVSLVMPCRNEAKHLAQMVADIPDFYDEIICVSNKSSDDTVEVGREIERSNPRFEMLVDDRVASGIGYGFAHMTGINKAKSSIIVCADSDGTYPIEDLPRIMGVMKERGLSFASCSRYPDKNIPLKLQLGVKILNFEMFLLYAKVIHDSLSGMWVFERDVVPSLHLTEGDWNLSPQIKLNAHKYLGPRFGEVRIRQGIRFGETKQSYLKTGFGHLKWIFKNRFIQRKGIQPAD
ncbi:glycosyltransferase family 2 protein [Bifidobacterium coryneforme]|uniref:Glycosyl transferase family protein n=1 Tax=Bifidobacterium [indicum] DSM 20214 = LMG 11587 TaxID=1341694 RepID=A0A087VSV2_9BIFI|nr:MULTISPECIES: glycosyltransferase family 2 protein [Bifidobacterium]AIC91440.1 glycosyl transferase family protein [Bifidobacterium indicum LMG 11587 = DSM 20214]AII74240.1 glycosyl transferase family protein [Bifidobacterium coryneforme]